MTTWSAQRTRRYESLIEAQQQAQTKAEQAEAIHSRYRDPLLSAAHNLQARLYNIVHQHFLATYLRRGDSDQQRYARDYTVYVLAEYLCWAEIIRRDLRFLDLSSVPANRQLVELLENSQRALSREALPRPWQLFRGEQRAIGELMMVRTNDTDAARYESLGYVQFCTRLDHEPAFAQWFARLRSDLDDLNTADPNNHIRLVVLQNALIDLIEFLDPQRFRLPAKYRERLASRSGENPQLDSDEP
jgi:hypothetical protein